MTENFQPRAFGSLVTGPLVSSADRLRKSGSWCMTCVSSALTIQRVGGLITDHVASFSAAAPGSQVSDVLRHCPMCSEADRLICRNAGTLAGPPA